LILYKSVTILWDEYALLLIKFNMASAVYNWQQELPPEYFIFIQIGGKSFPFELNEYFA